MKQGWRSFLLCAGAALTLSGCQTMDDMKQGFNDFTSKDFWKIYNDTTVAGGCPPVKVVDDLKTFEDFLDAEKPADGDLVSSMNIAKIDSSCDFDSDGVNVALNLTFDSSLGPKARAQGGDKPNFVYPYFVAVTSPSGEILSKEVYAVTAAYDGTQKQMTLDENLKQIIPLEKRSESGSYNVLVGFQLTDEQLAYNRAATAKASATEPAAGEGKGPDKAAESAAIDITEPSR